MGENLPTLRNCKVCNNEVAPDLVLKVLKKQVSAAEAARFLQVPISTLKKHIEWHMGNDVAGFLVPRSDELAALFVDKQHELLEIMERTKSVLNRFKDQMEEEGKLDANDIRAYTSLEKLLADNIQLMAKLSGEFTSGAMIQVNNYKIQIGKLTEGLAGILCERCQGPVLKLIETIEVKKDEERTNTDM